MNVAMPRWFWLAIGVALFVSFVVDFANTNAGGAIDLRNRITGARLLESGRNPYTYKWQYDDPDIYLDVFNNPNPEVTVSKTTATPALLILHAPLAALQYREGEFAWLFAQWALLLGTGWLWLRACTEDWQRMALAILLTGFTFTAAWRLHAERGQSYVLLVFIFAAWLVLTLDRTWSRHWVVGLIAGVLIALRPTFALVVPFMVLHRRAQLIGAAIGLIVCIGLPMLADQSCWPDYYAAMQANSDLYRNDINPAPGKHHYPPQIEGTPTLLIAKFALIPYADFSAFSFLRWLGVEREWLGDQAWPAWPLLLVIAVGFGLWLALTFRRTPETLLAGLAAWVFLADLFLPAYRNNYNDVLILDVLAAGLVVAVKLPWAVWPFALALPFGLLVYLLAPEQVAFINFPSALLTVSAMMSVFKSNGSFKRERCEGVGSFTLQTKVGQSGEGLVKRLSSSKEMNMLSTLFSFQGRVNRTTWWASFLVGTVVIALCSFFDLSAHAKGQDLFLTPISVAILGWPLLAIQVKRWHDRNKSGFWSLIGIIPYVGPLWVTIELGFLGPVEEGNRY